MSITLSSLGFRKIQSKQENINCTTSTSWIHVTLTVSKPHPSTAYISQYGIFYCLTVASSHYIKTPEMDSNTNATMGWADPRRIYDIL